MKAWIAFVITLTIAAQSLAADLAGMVVRVQDGDSLILLTPTYDQVKIRLSEIDAPEKKQPYGQKSKEALTALVAGKQITAQEQTTDRYGRVVAHVYVDGVWVNAELVRNGAAWVYRKYSKMPELLDLEEAAREAKRGLWALPESEKIKPWDWRKSN
ncbi:MAG: thermonuclease family protein [Shewanella sp.]|nr:thermonuclease family protein [Shewanella sp.]